MSDQFFTKQRFRHIQHLGTGSFGTVSLYKTPTDAPYNKKHPRVVIKLIEDASEDALNEHFHNQYKDLCIVMEYCDCGKLTDHIRRMIRAEFDFWRFLCHMSSALSYLHGSNPPTLHRDIKPDNVLGTHTGYDPRNGRKLVTWKLADFGIAKLLNSNAQNQYYTQSCAGVNIYMAPEVVKACCDVYTMSSSTYGTAADIWSLGALVSFYANREHLFTSAEMVHCWPTGKSSLSEQRYGQDLRQLHAEMLDPVPGLRPSAEDIEAECRKYHRMCKPISQPDLSIKTRPPRRAHPIRGGTETTYFETKLDE